VAVSREHLNTAKNDRIYLLLFCVGISPYMINGWVNARIHNIAWAYWGFEFLSWILIPWTIFRYANCINLYPKELGLHDRVAGTRNPVELILLCLLLAVFEPLFFNWALNLGTHVFPNIPFFSYQSVEPGNGWQRMLVAIYFAASAAIVEELYYRGLFYKVSTYFRFPTASYMVFSPLLFAATHWESGMANAFAAWLLGLASSAIYLGTRNLWPLILGHFVTDLLRFV